MKIKYKNIYLSISREFALCVDYINNSFSEIEESKNRFFFYYNWHLEHQKDKRVKQLGFKAGMEWSPQRMKDTMEDIKSKFELFQEVGGGEIEDFFSFLLSFERDEKLNNLLN